MHRIESSEQGTLHPTCRTVLHCISYCLQMQTCVQLQALQAFFWL